MHVKVSGTINRVSQIWTKVSGTWTRITRVLVKITPQTIDGQSISWVHDYLKLYFNNTYQNVTGNYYIYFGIGSIGGTWVHMRPGTYKPKVVFTLTNWPNWYVFYENNTETRCAYDGQVVTYPYTGHQHYAANVQHTVDREFYSANWGFNVRFQTDNSGQPGNITIHEAEVTRVS